jgi:hypothetical protein
MKLGLAFLVVLPAFAAELSSFRGKVEYSPPRRADTWNMDYTYDLRPRGRDELELRLTRVTAPGETVLAPRTEKTRYRLNQTIVGRKYQTSGSGDIFGGGRTRSCHYVVTKMFFIGEILRLQDYHVIKNPGRGGCPSDQEVVANFTPVTSDSSFFVSGRLSDEEEFHVADGRLRRGRPQVEEVRVSRQVDDADRAMVVEKPTPGGSAVASPAATEQ